MSEWQPIDTAPKDGTRILMYDPEHEFQFSGYLVEEEIYIQCAEYAMVWRARIDNPEEYDYYYNPTHWRPLPEPPK